MGKPLEFFAYQTFEHRRNINELRFIKELMSKPELLIELMVMARCAFQILYDLSCCPGVDNHENVNPDALRTYIYHLYELSVERHRSKVADMVVGSLWGNLPRNDSYPQTILGDLPKSSPN